MGIAPGLDGYIATRQQQAQEQAQQMQMIQGLMQMRGQMEDRQQRQQMFPLQMQEQQAKLKKLRDDAAMNAALGPLMANGGADLTPQQARAIGMRMAIGGHQGSGAWLANADRMEQHARDQAALQGMQSRPGYTPATPVDDGGEPIPSIPGQPGAFDTLAKTPYPAINQAARAYQQQVNAGGLTPAQADSHLSRLTQLFATQSGQDARLDKRQDQRIEIKNTFPPGAGQDHSPYTNVQSDNKGGFVGLNKKTLRMEAIPMAAGASMAGYGQSAPGAPNLTGQAFLDSLPPGDAAIVKAVAEGRTKVTDLSTKGGHRENIIKMANQYMPGFDSVASTGNAASYNKMVQQYDAVTSFERNANRNGDVLLKLADKVDSTGVPALERWIRAGRKATGDADVAEFNAQMQIYRTEAARILTNPNLSGQLTDSARHEVQDFLDGNSSAPQIRRVVTRLKSDFEARRTTLEEQMQNNRNRGRESKGIPTSAPATETPATRPPLSSFSR